MLVNSKQNTCYFIILQFDEQISKQMNISQIISQIMLSLADGKPQQSVEMKSIVDTYKQKTKKGVIMFAVHRGKVEARIDFSDKIFNDPEFTKQQSSEWYTQQAIVLTNQVMERVIRHINNHIIIFTQHLSIQQKI
ncbi:unnamed protein product [Paramecium sonneborni]|uniref:Uncharacterized protein n=1 Tax=Paramecium sonneborni TaxID=65129 RepID=A0A8S1RN01_9CILI|nr:unnamed protein product [Paramecium sonneborni]